MNETSEKSGLPPWPTWLLEMSGHVETALPGLWQRWSDREWQTQFEDEARLELLRSTTRLDPQSPEGQHYYPLASDIAGKLSIEVPISVWQAGSENAPPFSIAAMTGSVNLIAAPAVREHFGKEGIVALLGHELGHFVLWRAEQGRLLTAQRVLECACGIPDPPGVLVESLRRFRMFVEVYCDRIAALIGDVAQTTGLLRKMLATPREPANGKLASSLPAQIEMRIQALDAWSKSPDSADAVITRQISGPLDLNKLDLSGQHAATKITRELIDRILEPSFMQTPVAVGHARQYFADYVAPGVVGSEAGKKPTSPELFDAEFVDNYLVWLLMDFLPAKSGSREQALAHLLAVAARHGFQKAFCVAARRELTLSKNEIALLGAESKSAEVAKAGHKPEDKVMGDLPRPRGPQSGKSRR